MNQKTFFIKIIIFITILTIIAPKNLAENQYLELYELNNFKIFEFKTTTKISLDNDFTKPVSLNSSHSIDVTISFKFELPQFFPRILLGTKIGNWVIFRDRNHNMTVDIKLNLEKKPEWCDAEIENKIITINNITTDTKTVKTKLKIKINNDAPALEKETITLSAKFESESNWGLTPSEDIISFTITPEYVGLINAEFDLPKNTTELVISTDKNTTLLPVNITNIGNGESIITITIKDIQQNWNISIDTPEITLIPSESNKINVNITTPQSKERQIMNLTLEITSKSTSETEIDETYLQGQTLELTGLKLIKDDTTEKIDFTTITLGLIVILLSLIIITFFFKKKK
jgi:hypothetical protein